MKKIIILSFFIVQKLMAMDIIDQNGKYIKITESSDKKSVHFDLCLDQSEAKCLPIGNRYFYKKSDLKSLRNSEKIDIVTSSIGDVGLVVGAIITGGVLGGLVGGTVVTEAVTVGMAAQQATAASYVITYGMAGAGSVVGGVGAIKLSSKWSAINPMEQYRQVQVLSEDIINDKFVPSDRKIEDVAVTLNTVLSNLK